MDSLVKRVFTHCIEVSPQEFSYHNNEPRSGVLSTFSMTELSRMYPLDIHNFAMPMLSTGLYINGERPQSYAELRVIPDLLI